VDLWWVSVNDDELVGAFEIAIQAGSVRRIGTAHQGMDGSEAGAVARHLWNERGRW
jgi:hypothetical protein